MPYIKKDDRERVDGAIGELIDSIVDTSNFDINALPGILNYCITRLIQACYKSVRGVSLNSNSLSYSDYNSAIGVLECAKMEFYRRRAAPYEDEKLSENGDV